MSRSAVRIRSSALFFCRKLQRLGATIPLDTPVKSPDGVEVEFGPLDELTAPQESEIFKQRAAGHAQLVKAKVESRREAKARLFDDEGPASETGGDAREARFDALGAAIGELDAGPNRPVWRVPAEVRENARKGLRLYRTWERGGGEASREIARSLIGGTVNREAAKKMYGFLKSHRSNFAPEAEASDGGPTRGTITYLMWGGPEALEALEEDIGEVDFEEDGGPAAAAAG